MAAEVPGDMVLVKGQMVYRAVLEEVQTITPGELALPAVPEQQDKDMLEVVNQLMFNT